MISIERLRFPRMVIDKRNWSSRKLSVMVTEHDTCCNALDINRMLERPWQRENTNFSLSDIQRLSWCDCHDNFHW